MDADAVDTIFNAPSTLDLRYQTASVLIIGVNDAGDVQFLDGRAIDVAEWGTIIIIKLSTHYTTTLLSINYNKKNKRVKARYMQFREMQWYRVKI